MDLHNTKKHPFILNYFEKTKDTNNHEKNFLRAKTFFLQKDCKKALEIIEGKNSADEKRKVILLKADILTCLGNYEKAYKIIIQILQSEKSSKDIILRYLNIKNKLGEFSQTDAYLLNLANKNYKNLSNIHNNLKNYTLKGYYLLKTDETSENEYNISKSFFYSGFYKEAFENLKKYNLLKNRDVLILKGKILFMLEDFQNAGSFFLAASGFDENKEEAYYLAGKSFLMGESFVKAVECFSKSSKGIGEFSQKSEKILKSMTKTKT